VETTLRLIFKNSNGTRTTISIPDPRQDLTAAEVASAMNFMISSGIFQPRGYELTEIISAEIVATEVTELAVA
jgi:hypothetical protein